MQTTIHLNRGMDVDSSVVFYVGVSIYSEYDAYIKAHLDEIKQMFEKEGYKFIYMPEFANSVLTTERLMYYYPFISRFEATILNTAGCDYLLRFVAEEDRVKVKPAFMRIDKDDDTKARLWCLEPLKNKTFEEQVDNYLHPSQSAKSDSRGRLYCSTPLISIDDLEYNDIKDTDPKSYADEHFDNESNRLITEIRERISRLHQNGVNDAILRNILFTKRKLSRLVVTKDYRILLPDYNDLEIYLKPLPKAVFFLFLRHPEGIPFKYLSDYHDELLYIYGLLSNRIMFDTMVKSVQPVCDPTSNSINENCARIKEAFLQHFDEYLAQYYYVTGCRGCNKKITLPRELVNWECRI